MVEGAYATPPGVSEEDRGRKRLALENKIHVWLTIMFIPDEVQYNAPEDCIPGKKHEGAVGVTCGTNRYAATSSPGRTRSRETVD